MPPGATVEVDRIVNAVGFVGPGGDKRSFGRARHPAGPARQGLCRLVVHAHPDEDAIRVFHGDDLITTVPRTARKDVVVRKSGENN